MPSPAHNQNNTMGVFQCIHGLPNQTPAAANKASSISPGPTGKVVNRKLVEIDNNNPTPNVTGAAFNNIAFGFIFFILFLPKRRIF
jgi:hypothetical protein